MRNFERNRGNKSMWESRPVLIILGAVMLFFAWSVLKFWIKLAETRKNKAAVEDRVEILREQKAMLEEDIAKLETDRGKEEIFRENYGLAKRGEELIVVVEAAGPSPEPKKGFWQRFFSALVNWWR